MNPLSELHWEMIDRRQPRRTKQALFKYNIALKADLLEAIGAFHGATLKSVSIVYCGYPYFGDESKGSRFVDLTKIDWDSFRRHLANLEMLEIQVPAKQLPRSHWPRTLHVEEWGTSILSMTWDSKDDNTVGGMHQTDELEISESPDSLGGSYLLDWARRA